MSGFADLANALKSAVERAGADQPQDQGSHCLLCHLFRGSEEHKKAVEAGDCHENACPAIMKLVPVCCKLCSFAVSLRLMKRQNRRA